jgi:hypothetical protein
MILCANKSRKKENFGLNLRLINLAILPIITRHDNFDILAFRKSQNMGFMAYNRGQKELVCRIEISMMDMQLCQAKMLRRTQIKERKTNHIPAEAQCLRVCSFLLYREANPRMPPLCVRPLYGVYLINNYYEIP